MSFPFTPAHRPLAPSAPAATGLPGYRADVPTPASGKSPAPLSIVEQVAQQDEQVRLSARALKARSGSTAPTLQPAERLLDQVANQLFGSAGQDAHLSLSALQLDTGNRVSAAVPNHIESGSGGEAAHLSLDESAHFVGRAPLTTEDGRNFDVELEVNFKAAVGASAGKVAPAASTEEPERPTLPDEVRLAGKALPAIKFPGGLDDLFRLLGRELRAETHAEPSKNGQLTLRLLRLVDRAALLAPRLADEPAAATVERTRAAAQSYASAAAYDALSG